MKSLHNQRGTTLINVLMAAGIGAIILAGITSMITDVFKSQRSIQSKDSQRELNSSIRKILSDPAICAASFGGGDPAGTGFARTQILDTATPPNIKFQTGVNYLNNLVAITGFQVRNFSADNIAVNPKLGKVELVINTNKIGATIGAVQMTTIVFLQATLDAANKINSCYSLGLADSLWQISPINMADIYYPSGNVGIGTANPTYPLSVPNTTKSAINFGATGYLTSVGAGQAVVGSASWNGSSWVAESTGFAAIDMENGNIGFMANTGLTAGSTFAPTQRMVVESNGNVGIGTTTPQAKLDVAGGVRPGSAGVAMGGGCSPEGTFAYDMAAHTPVYCNNNGVWATSSNGCTHNTAIYWCTCDANTYWPSSRPSLQVGSSPDYSLCVDNSGNATNVGCALVGYTCN